MELRGEDVGRSQDRPYGPGVEALYPSRFADNSERFGVDLT